MTAAACIRAALACDLGAALTLLAAVITGRQ